MAIYLSNFCSQKLLLTFISYIQVWSVYCSQLYPLFVLCPSDNFTRKKVRKRFWCCLLDPHRTLCLQQDVPALRPHLGYRFLLHPIPRCSIFCFFVVSSLWQNCLFYVCLVCPFAGSHHTTSDPHAGDPHAGYSLAVSYAEV